MTGDASAHDGASRGSAGTGGMGTFLVVWGGQFVSLIGTNLTAFALSVFVYLETGSATQLAFVLLASQLPQIGFAPFAGALVDRWDRRVAMLLSDAGAGLATLTIAGLVFTDSLEIWHLYPLLAIQGLFQSFQWPAYTAATTLLVRKAHYGRAAGMVSLADAAGQVIAPALAGAILAFAGLSAILLVDVATFLIAVATLLVVRFPRPERSAEAVEAQGSLWQETAFSLTYLRRKPGLFGLLLYFAVLNLIFGFMGVIIFPLILGFADEQVMGAVLSTAAVGMVVGSLVMSAWGGPKRKLLGLVWAVVLLSVGLIGVGLRPSIPLVTAAAFVGFFSIPIGNGSSQAIWQAKVEPDLQGRVFAVRRTIGQIAAPLALITAGPLVDRVFQPWLEPGGLLAGTVGSVIGVGPGRGAGFMFILLGTAAIVTTVVAYGYPRLRNLEVEIPDAVADDATGSIVAAHGEDAVHGAPAAPQESAG